MAKVSHLFIHKQTSCCQGRKKRVIKRKARWASFSAGVNQKLFMSGNNSVVASIPSLVKSEDFHGQRFSSVSFINKTYVKEKNML